jgi:ankyrin repeat protein
MHAGAYNDQVECMELLEQHEGNVNAVDADGYTPLMIAAERGHDKAIGMLFSIHLNCNTMLIEYNLNCN